MTPLTPWKIKILNPKMEVDGRWFSFSIGWFLGSSRSFSGVYGVEIFPVKNHYFRPFIGPFTTPFTTSFWAPPCLNLSICFFQINISGPNYGSSSDSNDGQAPLTKLYLFMRGLVAGDLNTHPASIIFVPPCLDKLASLIDFTSFRCRNSGKQL